MRFLQLFFLAFISILVINSVDAQIRRLPLPSEGQRMDSVLNNQTNQPQGDSLGFEHRDDLKDSLVMTYRYLDSTARRTIDSSINDFDQYFSIPSTWQYLGNNGSAAFPLIYQPFLKAGFDAGFHAFDLYRFTLEETKIYRTNRPYSMLGYFIAGGKEQMLQAKHTQNPKPNINFGFDYRLITSPGFFVTQNTNHNNIRLYGNYVGRRKRYQGSFVVVSNNNRSSENGGVEDPALLADPNYEERFSVPVKLGNASAYLPNPFNTKVSTGNLYKDMEVMLRQSYDFGKHDSIAINDSTTEYLFYPKLRFQYTAKYQSANYLYRDFGPDSSYYKDRYGFSINTETDSVRFNDQFKIITNDFSILQFPDTKNQAQFFLAGITAQQIMGRFDTARKHNFFNAFGHAEYRNRTRNRLWEILASGEFYLAGLNISDYKATASLSRYLNKKLGNVTVFFTNVNRRPSFIFDDRSSFYFASSPADLKKENIISFGATAQNPLLSLGFRNTLITNYAYFTSFSEPAQYSTVMNLVQLTASTKLQVGRYFRLYLDGAFQQIDQSAPIRVPLLFARARFAYEKVLYKNLNLNTGIEARYYTPYKAYDYSPVTGQFFPQNDQQLNNRPDVAAFLHFRIKSFTAYIRAENLNTIDPSQGLNFTHNNFAAPNYPTPGFMTRLGIRWWFVN